MAILSDFDIFAQILNSSGMPQSEHYASKSAGYCLYTMLWDYTEVEKGASGASAARVKISQLG